MWLYKADTSQCSSFLPHQWLSYHIHSVTKFLFFITQSVVQPYPLIRKSSYVLSTSYIINSNKNPEIRMFLAAFWHRIRWEKNLTCFLEVHSSALMIIMQLFFSSVKWVDLISVAYQAECMHSERVLFEIWQETFLITVLFLKLHTLFKIIELEMLLVIMENFYLWKLTSLYRLYVGILNLTSFILLDKWDKFSVPLIHCFFFFSLLAKKICFVVVRIAILKICPH